MGSSFVSKPNRRWLFNFYLLFNRLPLCLFFSFPFFLAQQIKRLYLQTFAYSTTIRLLPTLCLRCIETCCEAERWQASTAHHQNHKPTAITKMWIIYLSYRVRQPYQQSKEHLHSLQVHPEPWSWFSKMRCCYECKKKNNWLSVYLPLPQPVLLSDCRPRQPRLPCLLM